MALSSIRPTTPADAPALGVLMAEAGLRPNSEPAHLEWKYWHQRADWPGARSFVMTRGAELLAHAAIIPGACLVGARGLPTQRVQTAHVIDWAAHPSATGAGVSLMKYIRQSSNALLAIGGSAQTLRLLPHLGFRSLGVVTCYVRPLHPARILTPSAHPVSTLLPRLARSMLWTLQAPPNETNGWSVRHVDSDELSRVCSVLPAPAAETVVLERSEELFRYALACPISSMSLYVVERSGRTRGYFLLAFALRQARLADWWLDSGDPADWRALLQCAVLQAKQHPHAAELIAWGSDVALSERLLDCGFHARAEMPVQMLAPRNPELAEYTLRVQMLDNDAAYRHGGLIEFLA
jgi:hypothetical protein